MQTKLCNTSIAPLGERKMAFTISTHETDRDGDTIDPRGWDYARYLKTNPVVLWSHDHSQPPIAKATQVWATPSGLHASVEFPPRGLYGLADQVHDLLKAGFLNATSVGFTPKASRPNKTGGQDITSAELLEFSVVSIGSNPSALVMQRGINTVAMQKWLGQSDSAVDLDAIFQPSEPEVDLDAIFRSREEELNIDPRLVDEMIYATVPRVVAAGLVMLGTAGAQAALNRLTGRLD